jgi:hypothetical protein
MVTEIYVAIMHLIGDELNPIMSGLNITSHMGQLHTDHYTRGSIRVFRGIQGYSVGTRVINKALAKSLSFVCVLECLAFDEKIR